MTEAEWLACEEPVKILDQIGDRVTERKVRLFMCSCCRSIWHLMTDVRWQRAIVMAERYADGVGNAKCMRRFREHLWYTDKSTYPQSVQFSPSDAVQRVLGASVRYDAADMHRTIRFVTSAAFSPLPLLRDIFGNPFHPITLSPSWRTSTVLSLAAQMYESRDFSAMPILGDALQDVGCDSADLLDHCRGEGPHVRGCWVVDLVLGKE